MCGRYVSPDEASIEREFNLVHAEWQFPASYNVAPTQSVPIVRTVDGARHRALIRWGLIPFFARGVPTKYSTINARIETVQTAASYRGPWKREQRCLVVVRGSRIRGGDAKRAAPVRRRLKTHQRGGPGSLFDGRRRTRQVATGKPMCQF